MHESDRTTEPGYCHRKAVHDKRVREDVLRVGEHVHLRNRVKGRNKIGDAWELSVYIIKERKDDTYVVAPMTGLKIRVINRTYLRDRQRQRDAQ